MDIGDSEQWIFEEFHDSAVSSKPVESNALSMGAGKGFAQQPKYCSTTPENVTMASWLN
jgi:hypothetical protein